MNLEELFTNRMSIFGKEHKSETPVKETVLKHISSYGAQTLANNTREHLRKEVTDIGDAQILLYFEKMGSKRDKFLQVVLQ